LHSRTLLLHFSALMLTWSHMSADTCIHKFAVFQREEKAYDSVIRLKIASQARQTIIGRFIEAANSILNECPDAISPDRQYTLKRKVEKADAARSELNIMTLESLRQYAITTPEKRVIYRNGSITLH
jgi:hypothetical protein